MLCHTAFQIEGNMGRCHIRLPRTSTAPRYLPTLARRIQKTVRSRAYSTIVYGRARGTAIALHRPV